MSWPLGVETPRKTIPLPPTTVIDISPLGDAKSRAFREHKTQVDHLALHDQVMQTLAGKEYYHHVGVKYTGSVARKSFD